ncbi:MAG: endopeptidase La [Deltaproteobacteria bacterium]|nr:endopeptidase La [Deltaproteobacteria bacterium]
MEKKENLTERILPVLPVRDNVIFPKMIAPLLVKEPEILALIEEVAGGEDKKVVIALKPGEGACGSPDGTSRIGTVAEVVKYSKGDQGAIVVVQGLVRATVTEIVSDRPYPRARVQDVAEVLSPGREFDALKGTVLDLFRSYAQISQHIPEEMVHLLKTIDDAGAMADMIAASLEIEGSKKQEILEALDVKVRLEKVSRFISEGLELKRMGQEIQSRVQKGIDKTQREYYLKEQLKAIQRELGMEGEGPDEIREWSERLGKKDLPEQARKAAEKELDKLSRMSPSSSEYAVSSNYLDWILDLPWSEGTPDRLNIKAAEKVLNRHHYDLERVKKRILEYLAVRKLNPNHKGPILCLVGPPGTGKTSLGRSVAEALGRKFVRISRGGVRDEAEIRGHRRTYVGALPGRIIQGLKRAESNNPIFMLDEIDKLGMDFRGDPASALLEVLDPEQNFSFSDHYLEVEFDLSRVMFITTANQLDTIPRPLLDRMEVLELPGYTEYDKIQIARRFLIPRQVKEHGLDPARVAFRKGAIERIIREYTREAGLRNLEREIGSVCRGIARKVAEGAGEKFIITASRIPQYLGIPKFTSDLAERTSVPGVATGMAWTPAGGDILFVEATMMPGQKSLVLTGQLGEVMKESAQAALSYLRSKAGRLGISEDFYRDHDLHIHVPAGAVPKDGPSAGVTMLTALASLLTCRPIRHDLAMTGEVTLRGSVLPVGGIKEKVLAASRSGIKHIILPERNKKDLEEIPDKVRNGLEFHLVKNMEEVLKLALEEPVGPSCN